MMNNSIPGFIRQALEEMEMVLQLIKARIEDACSQTTDEEFADWDSLFAYSQGISDSFDDDYDEFSMKFDIVLEDFGKQLEHLKYEQLKREQDLFSDSSEQDEIDEFLDGSYYPDLDYDEPEPTPVDLLQEFYEGEADF